MRERLNRIPNSTIILIWINIIAALVLGIFASSIVTEVTRNGVLHWELLPSSWMFWLAIPIIGIFIAASIISYIVDKEQEKTIGDLSRKLSEYKQEIETFRDVEDCRALMRGRNYVAIAKQMEVAVQNNDRAGFLEWSDALKRFEEDMQ